MTLYTVIGQAEREAPKYTIPEVQPATQVEPEVITVVRRPRIDGYIWGTLRVMMGWTFLWPFLDKVFGLGFAPEKGSGWIDGGSPTFGFLEFATKGPFNDVFQPLATNELVEWMFMLGLMSIGLALTLGVMVRFGAVAGVAMLLLMYAASAIWPEHNPFLDDHLVFAVILVGLAVANAGRTMGLGGLWQRTSLVKRYGFLK